MELRDKLAEIIRSAHFAAHPAMQFGYPEADALIRAGVILPPCKVGDTVWVFNQLKGCIYENKVHGIYLTGTGNCKNTVRLEYTNQFGEKSYRKYSFSQFGKNVFLSPEEAEQRKFEYLKRLQ